MFKHFIVLEWKSFFRSASFGTNVVLKVFMGLMALYFVAMFLGLGFGIFPLLEDMGLNPFITVNKYLIYYFVSDLVIRYFIQKMPVMNIRPLLALPIKRNTIVHFALAKTSISFFNLLHAFFFIPFSIMLVINHHSLPNVILWHLGIFGIIYANNYINILLNNKDSIFYPILALVVGCGIMQYYKVFDITIYTAPFFEGLYKTTYLSIVLLAIAGAWYYFAFKFFKNNLNLDEGLATKSAVAKTENFNWLNQFGTLGTFLKNDIKMIKRNKRPRGTILASAVFLFYGLLFFNNVSGFNHNVGMQIFAGIFVSGGFLLNFGQFVPSWDSSYYQLMMSQNIQYKEYLNSKWWLMVIVTLISTVLASFYLYFGWHTYLLIVVGAIYNIGVNSHMVLLGGAFNKTPIDITARKGFGERQAFDIKTMLIAIPKLAVPMILYAIGTSIFNDNIGLLFVAVAGVLGFAFREKVFQIIEGIYKSEKYATISAYKQKN
jgi:hypothetical protein